MGNSRKFVDRLQRSMTRAETKPAPSPAETPIPAKEAQPGRRSRDDPLRPEQLTTLREIVREEQLLPFKKYTAAPAATEVPDVVPEPDRPDEPINSAQAWKEDNVSNIETVLKEAMQIDGAIGVALVDYTSGMTLGQAGGSGLNLDVAAAGNTEVVRAKLRTMEALGLQDGIEDVLITLTSQYHLIRLINGKAGMGLFLYLALDKTKANLALARHKLHNLETQLEV